MSEIEVQKQQATEWFTTLRDNIRDAFVAIEREYDAKTDADFVVKNWQRDGGGGGQMSVMHGQVFEKVGVNVSTVFGQFDEKFAKQIQGAEEDPTFFATGISLVAHMRNPKVPSVHMNTRFIVTTKSWFGGGGDLNPTPGLDFDDDTNDFHKAFKQACDNHDEHYYPKFKAWCDEYFYIPHRNRARGVGGIFYDSLNSGNWQNDFEFTKDVGNAFHTIYPQLVRRRMNESYTNEDKRAQLINRGHYAEFNLVHDRGTKFGLMTGGNTEAILMSLPPEAIWP